MMNLNNACTVGVLVNMIDVCTATSFIKNGLNNMVCDKEAILWYKDEIKIARLQNNKKGVKELKKYLKAEQKRCKKKTLNNMSCECRDEDDVK